MFATYRSQERLELYILKSEYTKLQSENSKLRTKLQELESQIEKMKGIVNKDFQVGDMVKISRPMKVFDGLVGEIKQIREIEGEYPVKVYFKEYGDTCWYDFVELTKV